MNPDQTFRAKISHVIKWKRFYEQGLQVRKPFAEIRFRHGGANVLIKVEQFANEFELSMNAGTKMSIWDLQDVYDYIREVINELERL